MRGPTHWLFLAFACLALLCVAHAEEECKTCTAAETAEEAEAPGLPKIAMMAHPLEHTPAFHVASASLLNLQHVSTYLEDIIESLGELAHQHSMTVESHSPLVDMYSTPEAYIIQMDAPGYEGIAVGVNERGVLTIQATRARKFDAAEAAKGVHLLERSFGNFTRAIQMPLDITTEGLTGTAEHGVLTVTVVRREVEEDEDLAVEAEDA